MIVAGFGFRAAATAESLRDALEKAAGGRGVTLLAAPADKADAPCLRALAQALSLPVAPVPAEAMQAAQTLTRSPRVAAERGTGSVAEAAALAAAGAAASLVSARRISTDRTAACAIATGSTA